MKRLARLFTAWRGGSGGRGAPPPPDSSQPVRIDRAGEKLVEVVTSASGERRVGITKEGRIYHLRVESWAPEWEAMGVATWIQRDEEGGVADSLEQARSLAEDALGE